MVRPAGVHKKKNGEDIVNFNCKVTFNTRKDFNIKLIGNSDVRDKIVEELLLNYIKTGKTK